MLNNARRLTQLQLALFTNEILKLQTKLEHIQISPQGIMAKPLQFTWAGLIFIWIIMITGIFSGNDEGKIKGRVGPLINLIPGSVCLAQKFQISESEKLVNIVSYNTISCTLDVQLIRSN